LATLFVKVFPRVRLPHLLAVQGLTAQLFAAGCPVQPMLGMPLELSDDAVGLVYAYIPERFAEDTTEDAAQVGAALRSIHDALAIIAPSTAAVRISDQWRDAIARLRHDPVADSFIEANVDALLSQWVLVADILDRHSQLIHDYHRGNVLMGAGCVAAVLDFDDSISSVASPLVDLAIGLERFCLADTSPELGIRLAAAFLEGYSRPISQISATELERIAIARLLFSLSILRSNPRTDDPGWQAENSKFIGLIRSWPKWRRALIESGFHP
jgi:Ser/Thr protein kinase RdoA (MazF antagonist)